MTAPARRWDIITIDQMPEAVQFCCSYIERWWEEEPRNAHEIVGECLLGRALPFMLVARNESLILGTIMACAANKDVSEEFGPWLMLLYVAPVVRRRRLGTSLVAEACDRLRQQGYEQVFVDTTTAATFFEGLGWSHVKDVAWRFETTSIYNIKL